MNVVILQGSPRKEGYTARITELMAERLEKNGAATHSVFMHSQKISGCLACGKCKKVADEPGCIQQDDALVLFDAMTAADLILYASPLYFWGFSAQLKLLIDRTYALYTHAHTPKHQSLLEGKKAALVLVGAGKAENNTEGVFSAFERYHAYLKTIHAGSIFFGENAKYPAELDKETRQAIKEFVRTLIT